MCQDQKSKNQGVDFCISYVVDIMTYYELWARRSIKISCGL